MNRLVLGAALAACMASPGVARAETMLGSPLEHGFETTFGAQSHITAYQEASAGETLLVPGSGTITSWSVRSGDLNAEYELRVLRPGAGGLTAIATSTPQVVPDAEDKIRGPFPVSFSVKTGDRIGLYVLKGSGAPINNTLAPIADELNYVEDPFADGSTKKPALTPPLGTSQELLLQASFTAAPPENTVLPVVSGEARETATLTGTAGLWAGATAERRFQWLRCTGLLGTGCSAIEGATGASYTLAHADAGSTIRLRVSASNAAGSASADSLPTAVVQALATRAVLVARPPNPCTGLPVELDASQSQTPDPPLTYHYWYEQYPYRYWREGGNIVGSTDPTHINVYPEPRDLGTGPSPYLIHTFTWDRLIRAAENAGAGAYSEPAGQWAFDPLVAFVTVTDAAGTSSTGGTWVVPAQHYANQTRSGCPGTPPFALARWAFSTPASHVAGSKIVTALRCITVAPCAGEISVLAARNRAAASKLRRSPPALGAARTFSIEGNHVGRIDVPLTRLGRRLLHRDRTLRAVLRISSVGLLGRVTTRSFTRVLHRP
jgi:hypothetical protein